MALSTILHKSLSHNFAKAKKGGWEATLFCHPQSAQPKYGNERSKSFRIPAFSMRTTFSLLPHRVVVDELCGSLVCYVPDSRSFILLHVCEEREKGKRKGFLPLLRLLRRSDECKSHPHFHDYGARKNVRKAGVNIAALSPFLWEFQFATLLP